MKQLYSQREAAKILGLGRCNTLPKLIKEGKIQAVSVAGRLRISIDEIERIKREGTEPLPQKPKRASRAKPIGDREADALLAVKIT